MTTPVDIATLREAFVQATNYYEKHKKLHNKNLVKISVIKAKKKAQLALQAHPEFATQEGPVPGSLGPNAMPMPDGQAPPLGSQDHQMLDAQAGLALGIPDLDSMPAPAPDAQAPQNHFILTTQEAPGPNSAPVPDIQAPQVEAQKPLQHHFMSVTQEGAPSSVGPNAALAPDSQSPSLGQSVPNLGGYINDVSAAMSIDQYMPMDQCMLDLPMAPAPESIYVTHSPSSSPEEYTNAPPLSLNLHPPPNSSFKFNFEVQAPSSNYATDLHLNPSHSNYTSGILPHGNYDSLIHPPGANVASHHDQQYHTNDSTYNHAMSLLEFSHSRGRVNGAQGPITDIVDQSNHYNNTTAAGSDVPMNNVTFEHNSYQPGPFTNSLFLPHENPVSDNQLISMNEGNGFNPNMSADPGTKVEGCDPPSLAPVPNTVRMPKKCPGGPATAKPHKQKEKTSADNNKDDEDDDNNDNDNDDNDMLIFLNIANLAIYRNLKKSDTVYNTMNRDHKGIIQDYGRREIIRFIARLDNPGPSGKKPKIDKYIRKLVMQNQDFLLEAATTSAQVALEFMRTMWQNI